MREHLSVGTQPALAPVSHPVGAAVEPIVVNFAEPSNSQAGLELVAAVAEAAVPTSNGASNITPVALSVGEDVR